VLDSKYKYRCKRNNQLVNFTLNLNIYFFIAWLILIRFSRQNNILYWDPKIVWRQAQKDDCFDLLTWPREKCTPWRFRPSAQRGINQSMTQIRSRGFLDASTKLHPTTPSHSHIHKIIKPCLIEYLRDFRQTCFAPIIVNDLTSEVPKQKS